MKCILLRLKLEAAASTTSGITNAMIDDASMQNAEMSTLSVWKSCRHASVRFCATIDANAHRKQRLGGGFSRMRSANQPSATTVRHVFG